MNQKEEKIKEIIREMAADFFSRESNRQSLITVTGVEMVSNGGRAIILLTIMPEEKEKDAVEFAHRQLTDFKKYVRDNSRIARIPFFEVKIDIGEKNRQKLDDISKKL